MSNEEQQKKEFDGLGLINSGDSFGIDFLAKPGADGRYDVHVEAAYKNGEQIFPGKIKPEDLADITEILSTGEKPLKHFPDPVELAKALGHDVEVTEVCGSGFDRVFIGGGIASFDDIAHDVPHMGLSKSNVAPAASETVLALDPTTNTSLSEHLRGIEYPPITLEQIQAITGIVPNEQRETPAVLVTGVRAGHDEWTLNAYRRRRGLPPEPAFNSDFIPRPPSSFELTARMNEAFGNPKGDPENLDLDVLFNQCLNIPDEFAELMEAFGIQKTFVRHLVACLKQDLVHAFKSQERGPFNLTKYRDALCDIHVFAYGGHHRAGLDADIDMRAVLRSIDTRFVKDEADKQATIEKHAKNGITDVYFEGEYPKMIMKSGSLQPDAPKGKFLKSASYKEPVFEDYWKSNAL